jgi:hypothetical protein
VKERSKSFFPFIIGLSSRDERPNVSDSIVFQEEIIEIPQPLEWVEVEDFVSIKGE